MLSVPHSFSENSGIWPKLVLISIELTSRMGRQICRCMKQRWDGGRNGTGNRVGMGRTGPILALLCE